MTEKRVKCHSFLRTLRFWREMLRFSSRKLPAWRGLGFCFSFCFIFCFLFFRPTPRSPATGGQGNVRQLRSERLAKTAWPPPKAGEKEAAGLPSAVGRWSSPFSQSLWVRKVCAFFYDTPRALGSLGFTFRLRHSLSIFSARRARSPFRRRSDSALRGQAKCARWQGRSRSAYGQIPCGRRSV